ncbi:hypothetical protein [Nonomuraea angiospora]
MTAFAPGVPNAGAATSRAEGGQAVPGIGTAAYVRVGRLAQARPAAQAGDYDENELRAAIANGLVLAPGAR